MSKPTRSDDPATASLTDTTINGVMWSISGNLLYYVVSLFTLAILGRLLSPSEFGVAAGATLVMGLANMVIDLGVAPALVQRPVITDDHISTAFYGSLAVGLGLFAGVSLGAPAIATFLGIPELRQALRVVALLFFLVSVSTVSRAVADRKLKFREVAKVRVCTDGIVYALVAVPLAAAGAGYWSLIVAQLVGACVSAGWFFRLADHTVTPRFRWRLFGELMRFGAGMSLARVINYFGREGDTLVVARTFSTSSLGLYSRAYRLMVVPATIIGAAMDRVLFPALSRSSSDTGKVGAGLERGLAVLSLLCLPACVALSLLAPEIVRVVLGPQWEGAIAPFRVLALGVYFRLAYKLGGAVSMSRGAVYKNAGAQLVYAVMVVAGATFARRWGLIGVAWAVLIALIVQFLTLWSLAARILGHRLVDFLRVHLEALPATAMVFAVVLGSATYLRSVGTPDVVTLLVTVTLAGAAAVGAALALPQLLLGSHGRWWLAKAKGALTKRRERLDASTEEANT